MSLSLAGRWLLVASSHCFVLQSWLVDCFLFFIYCRRGLKLGSGAARGCQGLPRLWRAFWYRKSLAEHKGTQQEPYSRNPRLVSWGLHPTLPLIPSIGPLFVYGPVGGEHRELPLASSIKIILNLLFSRKCRIGWEAAIPGHLADILGLNLLEQSLSLFGRALSKLL